MRGDGSAAIVEAGEECHRAVERLVAKYAPYRRRPPTGPVIVVTVERWSSWEA